LHTQTFTHIHTHTYTYTQQNNNKPKEENLWRESVVPFLSFELQETNVNSKTENKMQLEGRRGFKKKRRNFQVLKESNLEEDSKKKRKKERKKLERRRKQEWRYRRRRDKVPQTLHKKLLAVTWHTEASSSSRL